MLNWQAWAVWKQSSRVAAGDMPHRYLDASVEELTLKKVVSHSVATARASIVFPVPGGPNINSPCAAQRMHASVPFLPVKIHAQASSCPLSPSGSAKYSMQTEGHAAHCISHH
jgi:hypothetical protein